MSVLCVAGYATAFAPIAQLVKKTRMLKTARAIKLRSLTCRGNNTQGGQVFQNRHDGSNHEDDEDEEFPSGANRG